ncbi:tetratricopeptide repeat protein [Halobacteria archaeon AArc-curdl1]|uniref:Tetratricopeptide repeat protein n=1 Tax=Natronosalvus hydrolyticus TaxID=2979988 RepID=A0AAP2ZB42_9EURY|nr:tetratricopeptide repeat protein [Halobacteria archaeon AArc-curdl1]
MGKRSHAEDTKTLIKRLDLLDRLCQSSGHVRDLVDDTGQSRATINRAINELEAIDLVERGAGGVEVTNTGILVRDQLNAFLTDFGGIRAAEEVLTPLADASAVDAEVVARSDVISATDPVPYRPLEQRLDALDSAEKYSALIPTLDDPRHVRVLYEHIVIDGQAAELVVSPSVFETLCQEFPRRMAAMAKTDRFSISVGSVPEYGLELFNGDDTESGQTVGTTVHIVVYTERSAVNGILVNEEVRGVEWAERRFEEIRDEATDRTHTVLDTASDGRRAYGGAAALETIAQSLPVSLEGQGFVRVDGSYFRHEPVADPTTAWRAGLSLAEVHTGYAIRREIPDVESEGNPDSPKSDKKSESAKRELTAALTDDLISGKNRIVLGAPGSGKSTICKRIACEWYDADHGPVYYRENDRGRPFSSVDDLIETATAADGHALIVVEDAVRPNTNAIFDAIRGLDTGDEVSVLLDAREQEWRGYTETSQTVNDLEVVHVPPLTETDFERLVEHFERTIGRPVDIQTEALWSSVSKEGNATDGQQPHRMLRVMHRLATYADPLADASTALEDAVADVYDTLADNELSLSVAVLANALNAAGIGANRGLFYAISRTDAFDADELDSDRDRFDAIDDAVGRLEDHVIFKQGDGRYRTVHEEWSTAFLIHLIEAEGKTEAARRFTSVVSALLGLADDPAQCERIERHLNERWALADVRDTPGQWANETAEAVYVLGQDRSQLVPLFVDDSGDGIELPVACSDDVRDSRPIWLGELFLAGGYYDRAEGTYEGVPERPVDIGAERLLGLARVASNRGEYDVAVAHCRDCLSLVEGEELLSARSRLRLGAALTELGEYADAESNYESAVNVFRATQRQAWEAKALAGIGSIAMKRGAFDRALEYYESSLELRKTIGDRRGEAEAANYIGNVAWKQGRFDVASRSFERSLELRQELGDRKGVAAVRNNLGAIEGQRGNYHRAFDFYEQSLELRRELGDRPGVGKCLNNLGHLESQRTNFDRATEYYERCLELRRELDDRTRLASTLNNLGTVEGRRGNYTRSLKLHERGLELKEELGDRFGQAKSLHNLGQIENRRGNFDQASTFYERSLDITEELEVRAVMAPTLNNLGMVAIQRGEYERGRNHCKRALEIADEIGESEQIAASYLCLGESARRMESYERANECFETAFEIVETEPGLIQLRVRLARARLRLTLGDVDAARPIAKAVLEEAEEMNLQYWIARSQRLLGQLEFEAGAVDPAREHLRAALDVFESIGAVHDSMATLEVLVETSTEGPDAVEEYHDQAQRLLVDAPSEVVDRHATWLPDGQ